MFATKIPVFLFASALLTADSYNNLLSELLGVPIEKISDAAHAFQLISVPEENVAFFFYTSEGQLVTINSRNFRKILEPKYPTKMIIHGWMSNATSLWIQNMASSYHHRGNHNVIAIDWSMDAFESYHHAASATRSVGFVTADFIVAITKGIPSFLKNLHLVGHFLGGHVAGFAGKRVKKITDETIDRITGLDLAGPLFEVPFVREASKRFDRTDASFTDAVHTQILDSKGTVTPLAHVDFYVSAGGICQLQWSDGNFDVDHYFTCGHRSVLDFYPETILEPRGHEAVACQSVGFFKGKLCDGNRKIHMGEEVDRRARGTFFLETD